MIKPNNKEKRTVKKILIYIQYSWCDKSLRLFTFLNNFNKKTALQASI